MFKEENIAMLNEEVENLTREKYKKVPNGNSRTKKRQDIKTNRRRNKL